MRKKQKKKVKCLVTASAMCYLVCFGRADPSRESWLFFRITVIMLS